MRIGYFLSSEEFGPRELIGQARMAEDAGFQGLWISDHYPTPAHFEQASELVSEDMVAEAVPCGPDLDVHMEAIRRYRDAGFDELYIQQIGPDQERFFETYANEILPCFDDGEDTASKLTSTADWR
jgi:hypothetical protein